MDGLYKSLPTEMEYIEAHLAKFGWENLTLVGEVREVKAPKLTLVTKDEVPANG